MQVLKTIIGGVELQGRRTNMKTYGYHMEAIHIKS